MCVTYDLELLRRKKLIVPKMLDAILQYFSSPAVLHAPWQHGSSPSISGTGIATVVAISTTTSELFTDTASIALMRVGGHVRNCPRKK